MLYRMCLVKAVFSRSQLISFSTFAQLNIYPLDFELFDWDEEGESRNPNDNIRGVDQTFQTKNLRGTISTVSSAPTFEGEPKIR